ncbi:MAG: NAD(+)/NADH kinase [Myxococcales bacterium]|nr:NAD(+)/NADH kinase [Myxococcales bacterium]MDP3501924.1 NAD(+)/NADH kinase [Myxococcales bacterium]
MKTIALIAKPKKDEAAQLARQFKLAHPTLDFLVEGHFAEQLGWVATGPAELRERAELVIVLGGDGTLIHAARLLRGRPVPILGVNLGSLGFMTEVPVADALTVLESVLKGQAQITSRMKLSCKLVRDGKTVLEDEVLNDIVIAKSALAKIADHETWLDGAYVATFKADGVIFATPTGSTAYSLSAGGPIVHPSVDCVVVTPICPHALTQRPIVVPADQPLRVQLTSEVSDVFLTIDGQVGQALKLGDRLEVMKSPARVQIVRNPHLDYFGILRTKLHWAER